MAEVGITVTIHKEYLTGTISHGMRMKGMGLDLEMLIIFSPASAAAAADCSWVGRGGDEGIDQVMEVGRPNIVGAGLTSSYLQWICWQCFPL